MTCPPHINSSNIQVVESLTQTSPFFFSWSGITIFTEFIVNFDFNLLKNTCNHPSLLELKIDLESRNEYVNKVIQN